MEIEKELIKKEKFGVDSVYAVTGVTDGTENGAEKIVNESVVKDINDNEANIPNNGVYAWNQLTGQKASSSGTIYGIYDLSGGTLERMSSYVANGINYLKQYGESIAYNGDILKTASTKYTMVYPYNNNKDNTGIANSEANLNIASQANYEKSTAIYGDAHRETSTTGTGSSSWYGDYSYFIGLTYPFSIRGGYWGNTTVAGLFAFNRRGGNSIYYVGFRAVLVCE